uniref:C2H2-type domain-containing protein n=1 Tax=Cyclopterus lumpus TaxID=8103 RepID=A0A8C2ZGN6_CYCLU
MSRGETLRLLVKQRVHAASGDTLGLIDRLIADYEEDVSALREQERPTPEMLRLLVKQRLHAASEQTLGLIDRFAADYEEEVSRLRETERRHKLLEAVFNPRVQLHRSDVQQLFVIKADVPPECLDLNQEELEPLHIKEDPEPLHIKEEPEPLHIKEDPEPLHIKEDLEDLWTRLEGEQLTVLEEADITKFSFTVVTVKSEDDKPQTSRLHQSQTEDYREAEPPAGRSATPIKTQTDGEDCGGSGPAINLNPHRHSHPNADADYDEMASEPSKTEVSCSDWKESLSDSGTKHKDNVWKETWAIQEHIRIHGQMRPFGCDVCGKRFLNRGHLNSHIRTHTGEKPFSCDVCGKRFPERMSLKRHARLHTGEKPFSCDVCGRGFGLKQHMQSHMILHTGEKPFSCDVCGKSFARSGTLKKHIRVHTG